MNPTFSLDDNDKLLFATKLLTSLLKTLSTKWINSLFRHRMGRKLIVQSDVQSHCHEEKLRRGSCNVLNGSTNHQKPVQSALANTVKPFLNRNS